MYVKLDETNQNIIEFPYSLGKLRRDNPNISFSESISSNTLSTFHVFAVITDDIPSYNSETHFIRKNTSPVYENGQWILKYSILSTDINTIKTRKIASLKQLRDEYLYGGISYANTVFQTDDLTQQRMTGAALAVTVDPTIVINWKTNDGSFLEMSSSDIISVATLIRLHIQACFNNEMTLKEQIENANTTNDIQSIDIQSGWPVKLIH